MPNKKMSCVRNIAGFYTKFYGEVCNAIRHALSIRDVQVTDILADARQRLTELMMGPCSEKRDRKASELMSVLELATKEMDKIEQLRRHISMHHALILAAASLLGPSDASFLRLFEELEAGRIRNEGETIGGLLPAARELHKVAARIVAPNSEASWMNLMEEVLPEQVARGELNG